MALLEIKHFDFLLPITFNLLPKLKYTSTFKKIDTVNNKITLFLLMQIIFRNFNFFLLLGPIRLNPTKPNRLEMCF